MIEQLWYTWSTVGFGDGTGFRVRAVSAGLTDMRGIRFQELDKHLRYQLPLGTDHYMADAETSPCCLALLNTPYERIIVHKSYVGKDAYGRPGVFFCHLLADFPQEIPALAIIELWRSPFWQRRDPGEEVSIHLPEVDLDTMDSGVLNEEHLRSVQEYLPQVIYAFFALKTHQKLYIAAKDDQVAALIWGLTRSLPQSLQEHVTFSTYESDISISPALIIGTDVEATDKLPQHFPPTYESEAGFAVNCYQPPHALPEKDLSAEYARFATFCQTQGEMARMITLLEAAESCNIQDVVSFLEFAAITIAIEEKKLTPEKVLIILFNPYLASAYLEYPEVQQVLLDEALTNALWWEQRACRALMNVRDSALQDHTSNTWQALNVLSKRISFQACQALKEKSGPQWYMSIKMLRAASFPAQNPEPWLMLLTCHCEYFDRERKPATFFFPWQVCLSLLKDWASIKQHITDISLLYPWFPTNWEEFQTLLHHNLPRLWTKETLMQLLCDAKQQGKSYPKNSADIAKQHRELFHETLCDLWTQPAKCDVVLSFFEELITQNYPYKIMLLNELLAKAGAETELDPYQIERLLHLANLKVVNTPLLVRANMHVLLVLLRVVRLSVIEEIFQGYLDQLGRPDFFIQNIDIQIIDTLYRSSNLFDEKLALHIDYHYQITVLLLNLPNTATELLRDTVSNTVAIISYLHLDKGERPLYMQFFWRCLLQAVQGDKQRLDIIATSAGNDDAEERYLVLRYLASLLGETYAGNPPPEGMDLFLQLAADYTESLPSEERGQKLDRIFRALLDHADIAHIQALDRKIQNGQSIFEDPALAESYIRWRQSFGKTHTKDSRVGSFLKKATEKKKKK